VMAEATSREACVERHRHYHIDISGRLGGKGTLQRRRIEAMVAPVLPAETVLDVGCNSGYLVEFLPRGCRCWGVDVAPDLVKKARRRLERALVAEAEVLPFPARSVDVVVLGEIIEHVHDPVVVLREAARVARRMVVGSTPHEAGKWGSVSVPHHRFHVRCFTQATLRETLSAGLGVPAISIVSHNYVPQMYVFSGKVMHE